MPPGGVGGCARNRAFRDSLRQLQERHSSLIAQMFWLGFRRQQLPYVRQPRQHGVSAWTLRKKLRYMADSIFAFTDLPIPFLLGGGLGGTLAATAVGAAVL